MRERHLPRACGACQAPMARQEALCWRCGAQWAAEDEPRTTLKLVVGGAQAEDSARPAPSTPMRLPRLGEARSR